MPNIQAKYYVDGNATTGLGINNSAYYSGAFYSIQATKYPLAPNTSFVGGGMNIGFSASRYNSTYKENVAVRPHSRACRFFIKYSK